ncbi:MAG: sialidase family protein [Chloroflexi bacterium]|nr:sialidase family protein [Chloroflexota bacterium]
MEEEPMVLWKRSISAIIMVTMCLVINSCMPTNEPTNTSPLPETAGPWDQDVLVFQLNADGTVIKTATFERAGVPTIIRMKDGRLIAAHQFFPANNPENFDKVAVHFSSDEGNTWTSPKVIQIVGLPEGMRFPFDPTLVALPDGKIRLYFTSLHGKQFNENMPGIYSAISKNGALVSRSMVDMLLTVRWFYIRVFFICLLQITVPCLFYHPARAQDITPQAQMG